MRNSHWEFKNHESLGKLKLWKYEIGWENHKNVKMKNGENTPSKGERHLSLVATWE